MNTAAIIKIAGNGTRINSSIPKQYIKVNNKCIFQYTVEAFENNENIDYICLVCSKSYIKTVKEICNTFGYKKVQFFALGGETGNESTFNGFDMLKNLLNDDDLIISHDGVRSLVSKNVIDDAINVAKEYNASIATYQTSGNVLYINSNINYLKRSDVFIAQTPICVSKKIMEKCESKYFSLTTEEKESLAGLDDLIFALKIPLYKSKGDSLNFKITNDNDLLIFKALKNETK